MIYVIMQFIQYFLLSMIAVKTTKFFVRALTFKEFSHNTYFCSLGVLQIIQF